MYLQELSNHPLRNENVIDKDLVRELMSVSVLHKKLNYPA